MYWGRYAGLGYDRPSRQNRNAALAGVFQELMAKTRQIPRISALIATFGAALVVAVMLAASGAEAAKLGQTNRTPPPACPKSPCQAVGRTTAIQLVADGKRGVFKARQPGKLVAWAIDLSAPNKEQRAFFSDFFTSQVFGAKPTARIAVLRRKGKGRDYKLTQQGPVVDLTSALGSYQVFTLSKPLRMRKGEFLALTIPTWAPAFAVDLNRTSNIWRASRVNGKCQNEDDIKAGKAHQKVGSTREYGCDYSTARVLYWGFYEPKRK